jgi:hypothetical protein
MADSLDITQQRDFWREEMDEDTRKKLAEVIEKKKQVDATVAAAKLEKEERALQRQRDRAATDAQWSEAVAQIKAAIKSVNEMLDDEQDMHFEVGVFKGGEGDYGKFGGLPVYLRQPGDKERYVYFNISEVGDVGPVFLIPHSGKNPSSFKLRDGSSAKYAQILTDFLSQVISYAETAAS